LGHRVHVRGVVLHSQPGSFVWMRDDSSTVRVQARQDIEVQPGDVVEVLGFPDYQRQSPVLQDAVFRKTSTTEPPAPILLTDAIEAFDHEDNLVRMEARLREVQPVLEGFSFTFQLNDTFFKGVLRFQENTEIDNVWLPGSKVEVTGICSLIHDEVRPLMGVWQPQSFEIILRSPQDLVTMESPPWWTPKRVILALGIVLAGLLSAVGVIALVGRRHLKEQAHHRTMAEAEFSAILTERNRMAREIHDTLAQGLTATSVQLRLARKKASSDVAALTHHLDVALQLVGESLREARNSIWNMRSQVLETTNLAGALEGILKKMSEGSELHTRLEIKGRPRRLAPVVENNLLRIGQEAITNAIKHAAARNIEVALNFGAEEFHLRVVDDGQGFDPDELKVNDGGFGLKGMRERAAEVKGELTIRSETGKGTEISLRAPAIGK
jgi:signal transduction histidine kinase